MTIILAGGGDPQDVVPIDTCFASVIDKEKPVLYVPAALAPDDRSFEDCLSWFSATYRPYGITAIELCRDMADVTLDERYAAVFVGGGNTFRLLQYMRQAGFDARLRAYLQAGGVYYGGSAGAILCGRTIGTAAHLDENEPGLTDLSGLDLLGGHDVFCHYEAAHEPFIAQYPHDLYVLHEESGLVYDGKSVTALGRPFFVKTARQ